jgi:hypothetical protein
MSCFRATGRHGLSFVTNRRSVLTEPACRFSPGRRGPVRARGIAVRRRGLVAVLAVLLAMHGLPRSYADDPASPDAPVRDEARFLERPPALPPPPPAPPPPTTSLENAEFRLTGVEQEFFARVRRVLPDLDVAATLSFYQEVNPGALRCLSDLARRDDDEALDYAVTLAERFQELQRVSDLDAREHERLLEIERMEGRSLALALRIRALRSAERGDRDAVQALTKAHAELAEVLRHLFEAKQRNQLIEVSRLEAEVRELRRLLKQRDGNRERIVERRYFDLTGSLPPAHETVKPQDLRQIREPKPVPEPEW